MQLEDERRLRARREVQKLAPNREERAREATGHRLALDGGERLDGTKRLDAIVQGVREQALGGDPRQPSHKVEEGAHSRGFLVRNPRQRRRGQRGRAQGGGPVTQQLALDTRLDKGSLLLPHPLVVLRALFRLLGPCGGCLLGRP